MSLSQEKDWLQICYYGDPGSGKTTAFAHAAKLGRTQIVTAENGLHRTPLEKLKVPTELIEPIRDYSFEGIQQTLLAVRQDLHDNPESWAAIGIDSVTELSRLWLGSIVDQTFEKKAKRAAALGEAPDTDKRFFVDRDYYGQSTQMWRRILRDLSGLKCHVAFTAHVRRDVDDDDGTVRYGPDLPPAMQAHLMGHVGMLIYTKEVGTYEDGRSIFIGRTRNSGKYVTKDRLNALPAVMAFPTLDRIVGYVEGDLTEETDPVQQEFASWANEQNSKTTKK